MKQINKIKRNCYAVVEKHNNNNNNVGLCVDDGVIVYEIIRRLKMWRAVLFAKIPVLS